MTRQLTITAAEWASVTDGTLWLVREGDDCACSSDGGTWAGGGGFALSCPICHDADSVPPAEFMQTSAPCVPSAPWHERAHAGCNYLPGHFSGGALYCNKCGWAARCPDCRIELVSPCLLCGGSGRTLGGPLGEDVGDCRCAMTEGLIVFGHAYAVGSPLPIIRGWARPDGDSSGDVLSVWKGHYGPDVVMQRAWNATAIQTQYADRTAALAHYGPSESLVGKWAIELRVVGS